MKRLLHSHSIESRCYRGSILELFGLTIDAPFDETLTRPAYSNLDCEGEYEPFTGKH